MGIIENVTAQDIVYAMNEDIIGAGIYLGDTIDSSLYPFGIYFFLLFGVFTGGGEVSFFIEHADDTEGASFEEIPVELQTYAGPTLENTQTQIGEKVLKQGCFGTKRYIRPVLIGLGPPTLLTHATVIMAANPAIIPTTQSGGA